MDNDEKYPEIYLGKNLGTEKSNLSIYIKPDFEQWLKLESWDIVESVYLLRNWHPRADDYLKDENGDNVYDAKRNIWIDGEMEKINMRLGHSIRSGELKITNGRILIEDLLLWAKDKYLTLPSELHVRLNAIVKNTNNTRHHCKEFDSLLSRIIINFLKQGSLPSCRQVLRELGSDEHSNDLELKITPDRNSPENIEYLNSKGKVKTITFKTFCNKISKAKKAAGIY